ncbi:hypothetical protein CR513_09398, partial [Mucuna pruriens]
MESRTTWMTLIFKYLQNGETPDDPREDLKVIKEAAKYTLMGQHLYRRSFSFPLLRCLEDEESTYIIEEVHEGVCGTHIGGRALASKIARAGYYWPTLRKDYMEYVKKCDKYQKFAEGHKAPPERLHPVTSPWPFFKWGVDILGPFPQAPGQIWHTGQDSLRQRNSICLKRDSRILQRLEDKTIVYFGRTPSVQRLSRSRK